MSQDKDIFTEHYALLQQDMELRRRLVENPRAGMQEHFGFVPDGDYRFEIIEERPGKITIMLPAPPEDGDTSDSAVAAVSRRIFDILFTDGVGGYLIPDDSLTWILRDMRARAASARGWNDE